MTVTLAADELSLAERLIVSGEWDNFYAGLTPIERRLIPYRWSLWRRPSQAVPDLPWRVWMIVAGRGFGKTRTGAEAVRDAVWSADPLVRARRVAIIAPTAADARDVMIEGESGLLAVHPESMRPEYIPSKRRLVWPNGAVGTVYSAETPNRLRGPQHDLGWMDEPASMQLGQETFDNAMFGLRLGRAPRIILTGTPRPVSWLRRLATANGTILTRGSTYANVANLAETFITDVVDRYEGTRLGRQEIDAEFLTDVEGALWTEDVLDASRLARWERDEPWRTINEWLGDRERALLFDRRAWRCVVAVDPPGTTAECGIVVGFAPVQGRAGVDHAVIVEDASMSGRPEQWGQAVVDAARRWGAERIVVEANQGGDMTRSTIHAVDPAVRVEPVTAQESKQARAEPVAALHERGFVHMLGHLPMLESQLITWVPGDARSPDRLDAFVHLVRELLRGVSSAPARVHSPVGRRR